MNLKRFLGWSSALCLGAMPLHAQETNITDIFERKLKEMKDSFDKAQQEMKDNFEKQLREQRQEIDALKKQLASPATNGVTTTANTNTNPTASAEQKKLEAELAAELGANTNQP